MHEDFLVARAAIHRKHCHGDSVMKHRVDSIIPVQRPNPSGGRIVRICACLCLAAAIVLLLGCSKRQVSAQAQCTVVAFGDSLTAGMGESARKPYTTFLASDIRTAGHPCTVVNEGIPGQTAAVATNRIEDIIALHPSLVIVELGGNDGLQRQEVAQIEANLNTIVHALLEARIRVILAGVRLPTGFDPAYAERFEPLYSRVAEHYHVALVASIVDGLDVPGMLQEDGIHPTVEGNKRLAKNVEPAVLEALKDTH
jgi:acyl-CoA thioesterase-1